MVALGKVSKEIWKANAHKRDWINILAYLEVVDKYFFPEYKQMVWATVGGPYLHDTWQDLTKENFDKKK